MVYLSIYICILIQGASVLRTLKKDGNPHLINLILVFVIRFISINKSLYLINELEISLWARSRRV
jgi:hypothetical protein